jgi:hypothetical protein
MDWLCIRGVILHNRHLELWEILLTFLSPEPAMDAYKADSDYNEHR